MLRRYCKENQWENTLHLFNNMNSNDINFQEKPDNFTVPIALKACAGLRALRHGKMVHGFAIKNEKISFDMFVGSALIEFYSKCGQMGCALKVFKRFSRPDVVLWTSMVTGYEQNGFPEEAVAFFHLMVMMESVSPNRVTLVSLVSACTQLLSDKLGRCVHGFVIRHDFVSDLSLVNSLLNLYVKTGLLRNAFHLFKEMPEKDVISWSLMIAFYAQNGNVIEALSLFYEMIENRFEPNAVTVVSSLQACAAACNLEEGNKIHEFAAKNGLELEVSVSTALIDMYMKCLSLDEAVDVFTRMPKKDVVSRAALLSGYALNGMAFKSIEVFRDMLSDEIEPDAVAIVKILSSCSELGVLQQALCLHGLVIRKSFDNNTFIGALFVACRIHHNVKVGELAAKNLFQLDPSHGGYYILLSNLYVVDESWGNIAKVRALVKEKGLKKSFGQSVIEVRGEVHMFVADDRLHSKYKWIQKLLKQLELTMR